MVNDKEMHSMRKRSKRQLRSGSGVERSEVPTLVVRQTKRNKAPKQSEKDLLSQVKQLLDIFAGKGLLSYRRIHVMPVQISAFRCRPNVEMVGMEDLQIYLLGGKTLFWELKSTSGKQSDNQIMRENELLSLGHVYRVIRSLDQASSELTSFGFSL